MLMSERHDQIMEILNDKRAITVTELSEMLGVTAVTIRSDLNQLAGQGHIIRTHGGATLSGERARQEYTFATRQKLHAERKRAIGELASTLIKPVESILLDASTTALAVGQAIRRNPNLADLTVVATGVWTALEMLGTPGVNIILPGGNLRNTTGSITGFIAYETLEKINLQKAFLGAWGISLMAGLTDTNLQEVELKRAVIKRCQEVIIVLDGSKFGQTGLASFATVDEISCIVTDDRAPVEMVRTFRQRGIEVMVANVNGRSNGRPLPGESK